MSSEVDGNQLDSPSQRSDIMKIFVSSTVHNLLDLRAELRQSLQEWGHEPLLSEFTEEFIVTLDVDSYKACIEQVRRADLFILIIDKRYGGLVEDQGCSITELEYRTACEYGIPRINFCRQDVWDCLAIYMSNPSMRFPKHFQEGPHIMEFLNRVRKYEGDKTDNWVHTFANSVDLKKKLINQLQYWRTSTITPDQNIAIQNIARHATLILKQDIIAQANPKEGIVELHISDPYSLQERILIICDDQRSFGNLLDDPFWLEQHLNDITFILPRLPSHKRQLPSNIQVLSLADYLSACVDQLIVGQTRDLHYRLTPILSSLYELSISAVGRELAAEALLIRSRMLIQMSDFIKAETDLERGRRVWENRSVDYEVRYYCELANLRLKQLRTAEATDLADRALETIGDDANITTAAQVYKLKARACIQTKDFSGAVSFLEWALQCLKDENSLIRADILADLAVIERLYGAYADALKLLEEDRDICNSFAYSRGRAYANCRIGELYTLEDKLSAALPLAWSSLDVATSHGLVFLEVDARLLIAQCLLPQSELGELHQVDDHVTRALKLAERLGKTSSMVQGLRLKVLLHCIREEYYPAAEDWMRTVLLLKQHSSMVLPYHEIYADQYNIALQYFVAAAQQGNKLPPGFGRDIVIEVAKCSREAAELMVQRAPSERLRAEMMIFLQKSAPDLNGP